MAKKINFEKVSLEALDNAEKDRERAIDLLNGLSSWMKGSPERHASVAQSLAKYLEVLQKSNETYIKVASMLQKNMDPKDVELSDSERDQLFKNLSDKK